jgi:hypothetical protein
LNSKAVILPYRVVTALVPSTFPEEGASVSEEVANVREEGAAVGEEVATMSRENASGKGLAVRSRERDNTAVTRARRRRKDKAKPRMSTPAAEKRSNFLHRELLCEHESTTTILMSSHFSPRAPVICLD